MLAKLWITLSQFHFLNDNFIILRFISVKGRSVKVKASVGILNKFIFDFFS